MRTNPSDFSFVNEDEALVNRRTAGRHEHCISDNPHPFRTGVPPLRETPKLIVGVEEPPLDLYGFRPYFVSDRAKAMLSKTDPEGFDFAECDTVDRDGAPLASYWMMNAVRVVDQFDEDRSDFITYVQANPRAPDQTNRAITVLNDIYMSPNWPESHRAFYLARYATNFIVDGAIADSWRIAKLTGAQLTPLQPPAVDELGLDKETPDYLLFSNFAYWHDKGLVS